MNDYDSKDETALSRTYVLEPGALKETRSLEELAELAEGTSEPEITASDPEGSHRSSADTPTGETATEAESAPISEWVNNTLDSATGIARRLCESGLSFEETTDESDISNNDSHLDPR